MLLTCSTIGTTYLQSSSAKFDVASTCDFGSRSHGILLWHGILILQTWISHVSSVHRVVVYDAMKIVSFMSVSSTKFWLHTAVGSAYFACWWSLSFWSRMADETPRLDLWHYRGSFIQMFVVRIWAAVQEPVQNDWSPSSIEIGGVAVLCMWQGLLIPEWMRQSLSLALSNSVHLLISMMLSSQFTFAH